MLGREINRGLYCNLRKQVALARVAHRGDPLAAQAEDLAGLRARRNLEGHVAVQGRQFDLATQCRRGETDGHLAGQVRAFALEELVRRDADLDVQVAGRTAVAAGLALTRQANAIAVIDTRRHLDRERPRLADPPATMAIETGVGNGRARTLAGRTGLLDREETLLHADLAGTAAGRARELPFLAPLPPQLSHDTWVGTSIVTLSPATAVSRSSLSSYPRSAPLNTCGPPPRRPPPKISPNTSPKMSPKPSALNPPGPPAPPILRPSCPKRS